MTSAAKTAKISTGFTVVYSKGRGGTKWPETRHTAKVDGRILMRKDGTERTFKTKEAALNAARIASETTPT